MTDPVGPPISQPARPNILVICTANVCRSPVVERLLDRHLNAVGIDVTVTSAGTHGGRNRVQPDTIAAAAELDVELGDHTSRRLTRRLLDREGNDLVVTLARDHLYHVIATDEATWPRTFTLAELARRAEAGASVGLAAGNLDGWVAALGVDRRSSDLMPGLPSDDIADPYGRSMRHHRRMVRTVDRLCASVATAAAVALGGSAGSSDQPSSDGL